MDDGGLKRVVIITGKDNYFSVYSYNFLSSFQWDQTLLLM